MVPTQALWELVDAEGIQVEWWPFERRVGMYVRTPELDKPLIILSRDLETQERSLRTVLAHELGHHFTTAGEVVVALDFNGQVMNTKAERRANEWAARFLLGSTRLPERVWVSKVVDAPEVLVVEPWLAEMAFRSLGKKAML